MIVVGIDPSLTGTGIIVLRNGELGKALTTKNEPKLGTIERVKRIYEQINNVIENLALTVMCQCKLLGITAYLRRRFNGNLPPSSSSKVSPTVPKAVECLT